MTSSAGTSLVLTLLWTYYNVGALRGHRVARIVKVPGHAASDSVRAKRSVRYDVPTAELISASCGALTHRHEGAWCATDSHRCCVD
jgi:hypothetical protein